MICFSYLYILYEDPIPIPRENNPLSGAGELAERDGDIRNGEVVISNMRNEVPVHGTPSRMYNI